MILTEHTPNCRVKVSFKGVEQTGSDEKNLEVELGIWRPKELEEKRPDFKTRRAEKK